MGDQRESAQTNYLKLFNLYISLEPTNQNYQSVNSFDGTMCKGQKKMTPKLFNKMISEPGYEEFGPARFIRTFPRSWLSQARD